MRKGRIALWLAAAAALALAWAHAPGAAAEDAPCPGCGLEARPAPGSPGPGSYFELAPAPGEPVELRLAVANQTAAPQEVWLARAEAVPLPDGGYAFAPAGDACAGAACWLTVAEPRFVLEPGETREVALTVRVPEGTPPGEYLAGVVVAPPPPVPPAEAGADGDTAHVVVQVVRELAIGVALTVGDPASLPRSLAVQGVRQDAEAEAMRVLVQVENAGGTMIRRPEGVLELTFPDGAVREFPVRADTILPRAEAALPVDLGDLPAGRYPAKLTLRYPYGEPVSWQGTVVLRAREAPRMERREDGSLVIYRDRGSRWPWLLAAAAGLAAGPGLLLAGRLRRRKAAG